MLSFDWSWPINLFICKFFKHQNMIARFQNAINHEKIRFVHFPTKIPQSSGILGEFFCSIL